MHMADALVSPLVGGAMLAATASLTAHSVRKIQERPDDSRVPLMGVMGAFVFAAQMINFTIPATGSSGHFAGGLLLAVLLGPQGGFLTMASVLLIQALFFGDGGLLAFGCNVFNLAFFSCFVAYPLLYRPIIGSRPDSRRIFVASLAASIAALQLGSFGVVAETLLSGRTELPAGPFLLLMQAIHLAIGIVEGLLTAAIITFVWKARPEIVAPANALRPTARLSWRQTLAGILVAFVIMGGGLSLLASTSPDGLEWSLARAIPATSTGSATNGSGTAVSSSTAGAAGDASAAGDAAAGGWLHEALAWLQARTAFLPDYGFRAANGDAMSQPAGSAQQTPNGSGQTASAGTGATAAAAKAGTSISGLVGGIITLLLAAGIGWLASLRKRRRQASV